MKKIVLKKLQSLTAIVVLNTIPVSFAETLESANSLNTQTRLLVDDDKKSVFSSESHHVTSLEQLQLQNSLTHIKKDLSGPASLPHHQYHMALALVEEAYQDDYDYLLDQYEHALSQKNIAITSAKALDEKAFFEAELVTLKDNKQRKIEEFQRQFAIT